MPVRRLNYAAGISVEKGQSGNPAGRPALVKSAYERALMKPVKIKTVASEFVPTDQRYGEREPFRNRDK